MSVPGTSHANTLEMSVAVSVRGVVPNRASYSSGTKGSPSLIAWDSKKVMINDMVLMSKVKSIPQKKLCSILEFVRARGVSTCFALVAVSREPLSVFMIAARLALLICQPTSSSF
jgi:hypothetical protein